MIVDCTITLSKKWGIVYCTTTMSKTKSKKREVKNDEWKIGTEQRGVKNQDWTTGVKNQDGNQRSETKGDYGR